ncbi:MAG: hypothetical protein ACTSPM_01525 [Candidatus Heimdallarchaeota archaeon]
MLIKNKTRIISIILVILSLSSLYYYSAISSESANPETISAIEPLALPDEPKEDFCTKAIVDNDVETPGNYKTVGYFTQNNFVDLDENGYVFESEQYEDLGSVSDYVYARFRQWNRSSSPDIFWHPLNTFGQLRSYNTINGENINSTVFSPVYTEDSYIQGKIYFMANGDVWPSRDNLWTLRVTLELFNPNTGQTTSIGTAQSRFDDTSTNPWVDSIDLASTVLIPAGYRLRTTYECRLTSGTYVSDSDNNIEVRSGSTTYLHDWSIDDTNDTFDNKRYF